MATGQILAHRRPWGGGEQGSPQEKGETTMRAHSKAIIFLAILTILSNSQAIAKKNHEKPVQERFAATLSPPLSADNSVDIAIEDVSTPAEVQDWAKLYSKEGEGGFEKALGQADKGYFRMMTSETMRLLIVESSPEGTGRRLQIVAKAPTSFSSSSQVGLIGIGHGGYPFTCIQLDVDAQGNGTGFLIPFAKLTFSPEGHMVVKPMNRSGSRLANVHLEK
jgi:hypothetical protein